MNVPRLFFFFFCILCSTWLHALEPSEKTYGLALVHGTSDHRTDADGSYWKRSFIDYLSASLPNKDNYLVVACDYSHYMWTEAAAGCTADQLLHFIHEKNIDRLIVYTHSNGGNVIRWMLSHPTYDARFYELSQVISQVIAIAPSSGGTILAEEAINGTVFEEAVGWLLGYRTPSVKQQRQADMAAFNETILQGARDRLELPVPFRVIIGSDISASPISSASYCNGYFLNLGLKITKLYLEACADGFLNCTSQATAGEIWFVDKDRTQNKLALSHNQSRHNCFGLEQILRQDLQDTISKGV